MDETSELAAALRAPYGKEWCLCSTHGRLRRRGRALPVVFVVLSALAIAVTVCIAFWPCADDVPKTRESSVDRPDSTRPRKQLAQVSVTSPGTAQSQFEPLPPMPGLVRGQGIEPLSEAMRKVDARQDSWAVEVFNDQAATQLDLVAKAVSSVGAIDVRVLGSVISRDFSCGPLRPTALEPVFHDQALTVYRSSPPRATDESVAHRGAAGFLAAIKFLAVPRTEADEVTAKLKIFRVSLTDEGASTLVSFHATGRQRDGITEQNATWRCQWTESAAEQTPLLKSIHVVDYEEIIPRGEMQTLMTDCTKYVLEGNQSFSEQLVYGIDHYRRTLERSLDPDLSGFQGISLGDVNGDGLEDVYICQQGGLPNRLFIQRPDGTLADVSRSAQVDYLELTSSALIIDLDNDGDQDLALATSTAVVLLANDGTGTFSRISHIDAPSALQSMAAADYDLDGDLDMYACGYTAGNQIWKSEAGLGAPVPYFDANNGGPNILLRNDGHFQFVDVTIEVGLHTNNRRFSFAATWEDYDNDGDPDLYVANDFGRNNLYQNQSGQFVDVAAEAGVEDMATGMSADWGDYDNDGWMDLYVGNMFSSAGGRVSYQRNFLPAVADATRQRVQRFSRGNSLFRNRGDGTFLDVSETAAVNRGHWAWASKFVDLNNDGWQDLIVANGFITHNDTADL